ncbi:lytic transglycosylase domain-containing protein [Roseateles depolymerans]|uniref:Lytic transglycosylase catalytic subunit n=1 Tax=Roseateles depolymerans TaxID=76731 RepID=A0A0U3MCL6_9BURK|nr:lytic transglycosylase domain-containing protein [Roseateles depolymerans]ALV06397.1 Lytic transglycosylase catalytic subunit [Roseateles depolymerans]REG19369.1 transglycosylase-like protein with SLT domain [Roseateles depolymerans]
MSWMRSSLLRGVSRLGINLGAGLATSLVVGLVLMAGVATSARAERAERAERTELWGYVDGAGMAHFASHRVDARYQPVLSPASPTQRVPGKLDNGSRLLTWLDISPEVKAVTPYLREAEAQTGVHMELLKAIIAVESGFRHDAVSPRGAIGLMQITAVSAQRYGTADELRRPTALLEARTNILIGARMLADLIRRFGRIDGALAAWNAGEGTVRRAGGGVPDIDETQAHVHLVLELYWALLQRRMGAQAQQMTLQPLDAP